MNGELILHYTDGTSDSLGKITETAQESSPTEWFIFSRIATGLSIRINSDYASIPTKIIIPSEYRGIPVTTIQSNAFSELDYLEEVVVPATVVEIGEKAFSSCRNRKSITMSEGLQKIGNEAFYSCTSLLSLEIPATVTQIGYRLIQYSSVVQVSFKETSGWGHVPSNASATAKPTPIAQDIIADSYRMARLLDGKEWLNADTLLNIRWLRRVTD